MKIKDNYYEKYIDCDRNFLLGEIQIKDEWLQAQEKYIEKLQKITEKWMGYIKHLLKHMKNDLDFWEKK